MELIEAIVLAALVLKILAAILHILEEDDE
jgi:hypothetical protein